MEIRRFKEEEAKEVSELIRKTIRISNTKDYPLQLMELLIESETPEHVLERASWTHFYVAVEDGKIIGCGAIGPFWGKRRREQPLHNIRPPRVSGKGRRKGHHQHSRKGRVLLKGKAHRDPCFYHRRAVLS